MTAPEPKPPSPLPGTRNRVPSVALWLTAAAMAVLVVVLVVVGLVGRSGGPGDVEPPQPVVDSSSADATLDLPADERLVSVEFDAQEGDSAVVTLAMDAELESTRGQRRAAYTVTGIACSSVSGGEESTARTGTENLEHGSARELNLSLVYDIEHTGAQRCNANIRVPNWDDDWASATMDVDTTLRVQQQEDSQDGEALVESEEPIVLSRDEQVTAIDSVVDLPQGGAGTQLAATSHLTTCTIENGSKDQTEDNLCTPEILDERGSTVAVNSYAEVLDDGEVCDRVEIQEDSERISDTVHHKLLGTPLTGPGALQNPCGDQIRLVQTVENSGPAPVVVHRNSSNIVVSAAAE